jgi:hypothetical protein
MEQRYHAVMEVVSGERPGMRGMQPHWHPCGNALPPGRQEAGSSVLERPRPRGEHALGPGPVSNQRRLEDLASHTRAGAKRRNRASAAEPPERCAAPAPEVVRADVTSRPECRCQSADGPAAVVRRFQSAGQCPEGRRHHVARTAAFRAARLRARACGRIPVVDRPSQCCMPGLGARSTAKHTICESPRDTRDSPSSPGSAVTYYGTDVFRRRLIAALVLVAGSPVGRCRKPWNRRPLRCVRGSKSRPGPGGGVMRTRIVFTVVSVLVLAMAVSFVAGYGDGIVGARGAAGLRSPRPGAVNHGSAITSDSSAAPCWSAPRRGRHPAKQALTAPPSQVRVTRTAIVTLGGSAGVVAARGACVVRPLGLGAGIHLCPPGFWRLYRLSVSGGRRHTPALFPFPVGCGAAGRAGTVPAVPPATPLPLVTAPG